MVGLGDLAGKEAPNLGFDPRLAAGCWLLILLILLIRLILLMLLMLLMLYVLSISCRLHR